MSAPQRPKDLWEVRPTVHRARAVVTKQSLPLDHAYHGAVVELVYILDDTGLLSEIGCDEHEVAAVAAGRRLRAVGQILISGETGIEDGPDLRKLTRAAGQVALARVEVADQQCARRPFPLIENELNLSHPGRHRQFVVAMLAMGR